MSDQEPSVVTLKRRLRDLGVIDEDAEFLSRARSYCQEWDRREGMYPEHEYEGGAFYRFLCGKFGVDFSTPVFRNDRQYPGEYAHWREDL